MNNILRCSPPQNPLVTALPFPPQNPQTSTQTWILLEDSQSPSVSNPFGGEAASKTSRWRVAIFRSNTKPFRLPETKMFVPENRCGWKDDTTLICWEIFEGRTVRYREGRRFIESWKWFIWDIVFGYDFCSKLVRFWRQQNFGIIWEIFLQHFGLAFNNIMFCLIRS